MKIDFDCDWRTKKKTAVHVLPTVFFFVAGVAAVFKVNGSTRARYKKINRKKNCCNQKWRFFMMFHFNDFVISTIVAAVIRHLKKKQRHRVCKSNDWEAFCTIWEHRKWGNWGENVICCCCKEKWTSYGNRCDQLQQLWVSTISYWQAMTMTMTMNHLWVMYKSQSNVQVLRSLQALAICECICRYSDNRRPKCTHFNWCSECASDDRRYKCTHFDCRSEGHKDNCRSKFIFFSFLCLFFLFLSLCLRLIFFCFCLVT